MKRTSPFTTIHTDDQLIVVNKAPGIAVLPDRYKADTPHLKALLEKEFRQVFTVHRIDADTSGVLVFAKTPEAHRMLSLQFQNRTVIKEYLAILEGVPIEEEFTIDRPLEQAGSGKVRVARKGRDAETRVHILQKFRSLCLARINTIGGRTHQIRVHLQFAGYPLACDPLYGIRDSLSVVDIKGSKVNLSKYRDPGALLRRTALHASGITIEHPDGNSRDFEADLPRDFRAVLQQLRKWQS